MAPLVSKPSHPELVEIDIQEGSFQSALLAKKSFKKGDRIVTLSQCIFDMPKRYTSVQYSETDHFELNNEFVYMNHSCSPSVALNDSNKDDMHVFALEDIAAGQPLTFFYPSTEWDMDQPFDCSCASKGCLGTVKGAKYIALDELKNRGFINDHILRMKKSQQ